MEIASLRQVDVSVLSASIDWISVLDRNLLLQIIGIIMQKITCPVREKILFASSGLILLYALEKHESAHASNPASMSVFSWVPTRLVPKIF